MSHTKRRIARIERSILPKEKISFEDILRLIHDPSISDEEKRRIEQGPLDPRLEKILKAIQSKRQILEGERDAPQAKTDQA